MVMVKEDYANACAEVIRILDYIPYKEYKKIPKDVILHYEKNASKGCDFEYDIKCSLDEQNVSKTAKTIIAILFRDYWATLEQKNKILNYEKYEAIKEENIKKEKYNSNDIFKNNYKRIISENNDNNQEIALVNISNIKWYEKIWKIIKDCFRK